MLTEAVHFTSSPPLAPVQVQNQGRAAFDGRRIASRARAVSGMDFEPVLRCRAADADALHLLLRK